jgi:diguanylate cyclase (GGDEF)-like protein
MSGEQCTVEDEMRHRSEGNFPAQVTFAATRDRDGRIVGFVLLVEDITKRKVAEEKITHLALSDGLTGLPNRIAFDASLRQMFAAARRENAGFAVLYLDLDHFKDVNDTLGHPAGDELLKAVGVRLRGCLRASDLAARFGGDEFAILQAGLNDTAAAGTLAEKLRAALALPYRIAGNDVHITASVGISPYTPDTEDAGNMLAQADLALYRAKSEGRDQYRFHSASLDAEVRERVAWAGDLRAAVGRNELELYYRPQAKLTTGEIIGIEAETRWHHPMRGLLSPAEFLLNLDSDGILIEVGDWLLDRACRQLSEWHRAGIATPVLAVTAWLTQLRNQREFVETVVQTLTRWALKPADLELDVTEATLVHLTITQNSVLDRLQRLGVQVAITDFGTQFSSLDYLTTYRVSRLKIQHALISAATRKPASAALIRAIAGLARALDIEVIAEGIASGAEYAVLSGMTETRGSWSCTPVPAARAVELLRQRRVEYTVAPPAAA